MLTRIGVDISKRQVVRLISEGLETFAAEDCDVLRAGHGDCDLTDMRP